jgi:POT family proton-dependent oligopeptide transporter
MSSTPLSGARGGADRTDTVFFGHPKGLGFLAFTEAWERFSYYGMQALLVLYMVNRLLLPGHIEHVAGFGQFQAVIEHAYGRALDTRALASAIFGLYAGSVYLTPILGGLVADRLLGKRRTVILGGLLMACGHFLLAFEQPFLLALLCLVLGVGCFKGNIASQVGALYPEGDHRAADAFQIFYLGINAGVILAPLVCGTLGEKVDWHWGFAAAGVGMLLGLLVYMSGQKHLPPEPKAALGAVDKPKLKPGELKVLILLVAMLPVLAIGLVGNQEIFNAYLVWAQDNANLHIFGKDVPITWLITLDSIVSVSALVGGVVFWQWYGKHWREPDDLTKIIIGTAISFGGMACLAAASGIQATTGVKVGIGWLVAFHVLNDIGFANVLPVSLALYSRAAPAALGATAVGVYYLHLFGANMLIGYIGGLLGSMPAVQFWMMHGALIGASAVILLGIKLAFGKWLARAG